MAQFSNLAFVNRCGRRYSLFIVVPFILLDPLSFSEAQT